MKTLALIGCGEISKMHTNNFNNMKDIVTPVAFCDLILERAEAANERCGGTAKVYTDYKTMLDETNPDMVFIAIPPTCHGEIELTLLERNIPFFVQKPMSLDIDQARMIRDKIAEKGLITSVGLQMHYGSVAARAREFAQNNEIVFVEAERFHGMPRTDWWRDKELSGGAIVESGIHELDLLRYIVGEVDEVYCTGATGFVKDWDNYNTEDVTVATLKFKNGAVGVYRIGSYMITKDSRPFGKMVLSAREKCAIISPVSDITICGEIGPDYDPTQVKSYRLMNGGVEPSRGEPIRYEKEFDHSLKCDRTFVEAVISGDGSKIINTYAESFKSLALALACRKSLDTGLPVKVEQK